MADSKIDYLLASPGYLPGKVFNPWIGCDKCDEHGNVREGCRHCWAEMWARRSKRFAGHWGKDAPRYFLGESYWRQPLRWQRQCERKGKRMRLAGAMCDAFEELPAGHPDRERMANARAQLWWLIGQTPALDWLLLTKRPENIAHLLPAGKHGGWTSDMAPATITWPPDNLHLGVSIWDQPSADRNIPLLLEVPAALRWVNYEPALGPVKLELGCEACQGSGAYPLHAPSCESDLCALNGDEFSCDGGGIARCCKHAAIPGIRWFVTGCESRGPRPGRPCDWRWIRSVAEQCKAAGVPVWTKQLPDIRPGQKRLIKSQQLAAERWPVQLPDARLLAPQRTQETVSRGGRAASRTGQDPA